MNATGMLLLHVSDISKLLDTTIKSIGNVVWLKESFYFISSSFVLTQGEYS